MVKAFEKFLLCSPHSGNLLLNHNRIPKTLNLSCVCVDVKWSILVIFALIIWISHLNIKC